MGDNKKDMTIAQFLGLEPCEVKINTKEFSILIGNGLGKSHPTEKRKFTFDHAKISESITEWMTEEFSKMKFDCPERLFSMVHMKLILSALQAYIDAEIDHRAMRSKKLRKFMKGFDSIFTINYDPIIYWNIFENKDSDVKDFIDGFRGTKEMIADDIKDNLDNHYSEATKIYYLHGSFYILKLYKGSEVLYKKLKFKDGSTILEQAKEQYVEEESRLLSQTDEYKDYDFDDSNCVISSRSIFKDALIRSDLYLSLCMEKFKESKKLLIFGCSLQNDRHILKAIKDRDSKIKELFICYKDDDHKTAIKNIINEEKLSDYVYIEYIDSSKIADIIWDDNKVIEL